MRYLLVTLILSVTVVYDASTQTQSPPKYDSRYDYLDIDAILDSRRLVTNYVECLLNERPCTPEGKALRRLLPEALRTKCARCTERQRASAVKIIHRLRTEYKEEWKKLSKRWDPTGDFTRYFEEVIAKENSVYGSDTSGRPPHPPTVNVPEPAVTVVSPSTPPPVPPSLPSVGNRFGDEDKPTTNNIQQSSTVMPVMVPTPTSSRPYPIPNAIPSETSPTRFTLVPRPISTNTPLLDATATVIDHFGTKLIRTTEVIADIMFNTVRAVLGRKQEVKQ